jgi:hypothetical protein
VSYNIRYRGVVNVSYNIRYRGVVNVSYMVQRSSECELYGTGV